MLSVLFPRTVMCGLHVSLGLSECPKIRVTNCCRNQDSLHRKRMGYSVSPSLTHNATVLTPAEVQLRELTPDRSHSAQRENFFLTILELPDTCCSHS